MFKIVVFQKYERAGGKGLAGGLAWGSVGGRVSLGVCGRAPLEAALAADRKWGCWGRSPPPGFELYLRTSGCGSNLRSLWVGFGIGGEEIGYCKRVGETYY